MISREREFDRAALETDGYVVLDRLVNVDRLTAFENTVEQFATEELKRRDVERLRKDALHDLFLSDKNYRETLFPLLKYLKIVQLMSAEVGSLLAAAGLLEALGIKYPLLWPSLRVDLPDESTYLLPLHQDYRSMKCSRSFRLWIPLRDADRHNGTIAPGARQSSIRFATP